MFNIIRLQEHIPPEIYRRAADYHRQQRVTTLVETSAGKWQAIVSGSENYQVRIQLNGNLLLKATCTCPHDVDICKNIAATLMMIQEEKEQTEEENQSTAGKNTGKKNATGKLPDITHAIRQFTREELQNLVRQYAAQSREFKNFLIIHLLSRNNPAGKESYRHLIKQAVKPFVRKGFIEYADSFKAMKPLTELADEADAQVQKGFYRDAVEICSALVEELAGIIDYMDDSAGFIADLSNAAFSTLHKVVASDAPHATKEELFTYALQERKKEKYQGWDWADDFFELAIAAATEEQQHRQLLREIEAGLEQAKKEKGKRGRDIRNSKLAQLENSGAAESRERSRSPNHPATTCKHTGLPPPVGTTTH